MGKIKITLGFWLVILTTAAIFVTNFVMLTFWVSDRIAREARFLKLRLSDVALSTKPAAQNALPPALQSLLQDIPCGCVFWQGIFHPGSTSEAACVNGLKPIIATTQKRNAAVIFPEASIVSLFASNYLYVAQPNDSKDGYTEAVGAGIPLQQILLPVWNKEKVIVLYLFFNGLILATLAFLRLLKSFVAPIERLARAAETYQGDNLDSFLVEKPNDPMGQLTHSIHAMVSRIETDKGILAKTVNELAHKNILLQENQQDMIRAEKLASVGRLAAGLAHEIGNPLGVTQGYLQLIAMDGVGEDERADYAARAMKELERVDGLIRQLLDYARSSKSKPEQFDVHEFLAELVEALKVQPFLEGIRLELVLQAGESFVVADREQLRQVVLNCLMNAVDAIRSAKGNGQGQISMTTSVARQSPSDGHRPFLRIDILDNGEGIGPDVLDKVFDPFFTTKEPGAGTGLGLSVSLALIESMGGKIMIQSVPNEGTTIQLLLPIEHAELEKPAGPAGDNGDPLNIPGVRKC